MRTDAYNVARCSCRNVDGNVQRKLKVEEEIIDCHEAREETMITKTVDLYRDRKSVV